MDLTHAHDAMVSDLTRLKKLVKAKDAQIEALSSRIEVLMDDMHEMRSERDAEVMRLRQKDAQLQKELEAFAAREMIFEAKLDTANLRAEEAEKALEACEMDFAGELAALKELREREAAVAPVILASEASEEAKSVPTMSIPAMTIPMPAITPSIMKPRAVMPKTPVYAQEEPPPPPPPPAVSSSGKDAEEAQSTPVGSAFKMWNAKVEAETLEQNTKLKDQVSALTQSNNALRREIESMNDMMILRTEAELKVIPSNGVEAVKYLSNPPTPPPDPLEQLRAARASPHLAEPPPAPTPPPPQPVSHSPVSHAAAEALAKEMRPIAATPPPSQRPSFAVPLSELGSGGSWQGDSRGWVAPNQLRMSSGGENERQRWQNELNARLGDDHVRTVEITADILVGAAQPKGLKAASSTEGAAATLVNLNGTSPQGSAAAAAAAGPKRPTTPHSGRSSRSSGLPDLAAAPAPSGEPPQSKLAGAYVYGSGTYGGGMYGGGLYGGAGRSPHAHRTKHAHKSQTMQEAAERRVHEQIRMMLVAKETALSAVASL